MIYEKAVISAVVVAFQIEVKSKKRFEEKVVEIISEPSTMVCLIAQV